MRTGTAKVTWIPPPMPPLRALPGLFACQDRPHAASSRALAQAFSSQSASGTQLRFTSGRRHAANPRTSRQDHRGNGPPPSRSRNSSRRSQRAAGGSARTAWSRSVGRVRRRGAGNAVGVAGRLMSGLKAEPLLLSLCRWRASTPRLATSQRRRRKPVRHRRPGLNWCRPSCCDQTGHGRLQQDG